MAQPGSATVSLAMLLWECVCMNYMLCSPIRTEEASWMRVKPCRQICDSITSWMEVKKFVLSILSKQIWLHMVTSTQLTAQSWDLVDATYNNVGNIVWDHWSWMDTLFNKTWGEYCMSTYFSYSYSPSFSFHSGLFLWRDPDYNERKVNLLTWKKGIHIWACLSLQSLLDISMILRSVYIATVGPAFYMPLPF